ncbi:MAG TPA: ATP-binding protein [Solirubrobacteraceae bacterium]|jgi:anti-sigma regulatory factor (Ser/Thr protein kinase)|nr:ATP-binding protein [Solirubrobacteraceae bacterium]
MPSAKDYEEGTGLPAPLELAVDRNVQAPAIARAALSGMCQDLRLDGSLRQTLVLLISEVVSNAVLHSSGPAEAPITIVANVTQEVFRVSVTDAGHGFVPSGRDPARVEGGYGLYLLEKAASRWGVEESSPTTVWFELPLRA